MANLFEAFGRLPPLAMAAILALVAVQLSLQIFSLIDLRRRSRVPGGRKWPWAILIVVGNLVGAILYLALGRSLALPAADPGATGTAEARKQALDQLYGERDRR